MVTKREIAKVLVKSALEVSKVKAEAEKNGLPVAPALEKRLKARAEAVKRADTKPEPKAAKPEPKQSSSSASAKKRMLYTIRLEPEIIDKLYIEGDKRGISHAAVAREILTKGVQG
jgi:uncharacterized protein (DUF4415 family)